MHIADALAIALVVLAGAAFMLCETALATAADLRALYWLAVGVVSIRSAVQLARAGVTSP